RARGLEMPDGLGEVARRVGGLDVVDAVEERTERPAPTGGRDRAVDAPARDEAHGVAAARGGVRPDEARLEQPLEVRLLAVLGAHPEATVEHEDHALILLLAVLAADEATVTRDGFPVDLAEGVALAEVADLMELEAVPAHAPQMCAARGHVPAGGRDGVRDDAEVGIDARR